MKKELLISAKFDTSDFDKSVDSMQKKLREMYAPSDTIRMQKTSQALQSAGYGGLQGAPGTQDVQSKTAEYKKNLDKSIKEEKTALEGKIKNLTKEEDLYKKISKQYQDVVKAGKEDLKLKEQLKGAQESLSKAVTEELESETKINALLKEKQRMSFTGQLAANYQKGGVGGALGGMMGLSPGMGAMVGGLAGGAAALGGQLLGDYAQRPMSLIHAQGAAMGGTAGKTLGQMQSGEYAFEGMYGQERGQAGEKATVAKDRQSFMDGLKALTGVGLIFSERARAMVFDPQKYAAMQSQDYAENFNSALGAEKEMSPLKKDSIERLQKNMYKDLASQRQMGLSDKEMFGPKGFLQNALDSGFMEDMARDASKGIAAAGGSTEMQRSAVTALKAERGLGVTNAGGMLGQLSGAMGSAETSKQSLIEIFAEGQARGLDRSKYAAENRQFMQNVADVVSSGSMTSRAGAADVAGTMGNFTTGTNTMKGIENARAAYEAYQTSTTATAGYSGAMNAAVMMKQFPDLVKGMGKDPAMMQYMMSLTQKELDPDSPIVKSLMSNYNKNNQSNLTGQQFVQRIQEMHAAQAESQAPGAKGMSQDISRDIIAYAKAHKGSTEGYEPTGAAGDEFAKVASRLKMVPELSGLNAPQMKQYIMGRAAEGAENMPEGAGFKSELEKLKEKYKTSGGAAIEAGPEGSGRAIDKVIAASSEGAKTSLETLSKSIDKFASDAIAAAAKISGQMPMQRSAEGVYDKTSKTGFFEGMLGLDAEASEGARKIQQNIATGRDPYEGVYMLERFAYERAAKGANKQTQAAPGK
jgi:hypothetical protein